MKIGTAQHESLVMAYTKSLRTPTEVPKLEDTHPKHKAPILPDEPRGLE